MRTAAALFAIAIAACSQAHPLGDAAVPHDDAARADAAPADAARLADAADGDGGLHDAMASDGPPAIADAHGSADAHVTPDGPGGGPITGGPCHSGAPGATAFRIHWANGGGSAYIDQTVDGLPDHSRGKGGAYGYQIPFTASYVDPFLGDGGVALDDSDFIDLEISTAQLASITQATLAIYGRSYDTTTSGSFNWQTFDGDGYGETATNAVSNVAPYQWYAADATGELTAGDAGALIRIKAGPSSDSLVVNQIELCVVAQ